MLAVACAVASAGAALTFATPSGWQVAEPHSSMRVAQFTLPRATGDSEDAELVLYYFGGGGGSVDANIDRWLGQIRQPDGSATTARRDERTVNGLALTLIDASGRYVAAAMPGVSEQMDKPNYRLRAGVVQTPHGPYFIKLTGPQKTVAKWDKAFETFIASLKYQA